MNPPADKETRSLRFFYVWLILLTLGRLVLCGREEIVTSYSPHDDYWHIHSAARWYWMGEYGTDTLFHLPLYSLFISAVSLTGTPLRLVMDLCFSGAICYLACALRLIGFSRLTVGAAALVGMYHPITFQAFNSCGAEKLLTPVLLAALAASFFWWKKRGPLGEWRSAVIASVLWALAWNLRKESILIAGILLLFAGCVACRERPWQGPILRRRLLAGFALPLLAAIGLSLIFQTANYFRWGLFSTSIITAPGYVAAFRALQSIPPARHIDYMPITVDVREKAYAVSPTLALIRETMEDRVTANWTKFSQEFTDSKGMTGLDPREISAGWVYWAFHDAVILSGHGRTPVEENDFFQKAAQEIKAAQKKGRLASRWVPVTFIDADWLKWLIRVPDSFRVILAATLKPSVRPPPLEDPLAVMRVGREYDEIANRRPHLLQRGKQTPHLLWGWVRSPGDLAQTLILSSPRGLIPSQTVFIPPASPVDNAFFYLASDQLTAEDLQKGWLTVDFRTAGKKSFALKKLVTLKATGNPGEPGYAVKIREITASQPPSNWRFLLQQRWETFYLSLLKPGIWSVILLPIAMIWGIIRANLPDTLLLTFSLTLVVFERLLFFSVLDASSWWGSQPRYLLAVMPLQAMLVVLIFAETFRAIVPLLKRPTSVST